MIGKITKGARVGDVAHYLHGPGNDGEHTYGGKTGGMVIGGNLGREGTRDPRGWAADMQAYTRTSESKKPIWQVSLRNAENDRIMSDDEWAEAGQLFAEDMGFAERPWVMVRHADDHVHIVMCRLNESGAQWSDWGDRQKMMEAKSKLEKRYGLTEVPLPQKHQEATDKAGHKLTHAEHKKAQRTNKIPNRVRIAERVRQARDTAITAGGRELFEQQMEGLGLEYRRSETKAGKIRGYAFHLKGDYDKDGEKIFYPSSKLDKSLSWPKLGPQLDEAPALHEPDIMAKEPFGTKKRIEEAVNEEVPRPTVEKRMLETKGMHQRRQETATQQWQEQWGQTYVEKLTELRSQNIQEQLPAQAQAIDKELGVDWGERSARFGKSGKQRKDRTDKQEQAKQDEQQQRKAAFDAKQEAEHQAQLNREQQQREQMNKMLGDTRSSAAKPTRSRQRDAGPSLG